MDPSLHSFKTQIWNKQDFKNPWSGPNSLAIFNILRVFFSRDMKVSRALVRTGAMGAWHLLLFVAWVPWVPDFSSFSQFSLPNLLFCDKYVRVLNKLRTYWCRHNQKYAFIWNIPLESSNMRWIMQCLVV